MVSQENRKMSAVSWQDGAKNQLVYSEEDPKNGRGSMRLRLGPELARNIKILIFEKSRFSLFSGGGHVVG